MTGCGGAEAEDANPDDDEAQQPVPGADGGEDTGGEATESGSEEEE
jgi:hypothetical protein